MEKDSFEKQLRNKVLQAESALSQNTDKERVWNSIQKKQQPRRKLYYAAAAIFFLLALVSVLYVKQDKTIVIVAKTKQNRKPLATDVPKLQVLQQNGSIEQIAVPFKSLRKEQIVVVVKPIANVVQALENNTSKETLPIVVQQKTIEPAATIVMNTIEKTTPLIAAPMVVPEFTVQFKRGKPTDDVEVQTKAAIARLKKFKLSKDTSILANTVEKQKSLFKIKF